MKFRASGRSAVARPGGRNLRRIVAALALTGTLLGPAGAVQAQSTPPPATGGQVTLTPNSGAGPGGAQLQQLVNWGAGMALIACVAAMVFHALRWGWGSQQHNMARVQDGKEGVGRAAMVAGVIAAAALVNFAAGLGSAVQ